MKRKAPEHSPAERLYFDAFTLINRLRAAHYLIESAADGDVPTEDLPGWIIHPADVVMADAIKAAESIVERLEFMVRVVPEDWKPPAAAQAEAD